jgi:outer membrane receptor protein involved in Fe transport
MRYACGARPGAWGAAAIAAFTAAPLLAAFEGRLLRADGRPVEGCVVSVVSQGATAPCEAGGRFVLDPAPRVPFALVFSSPNGDVSAPYEVEEMPAGPVDIVLPEVVRDSVTVVSGVAPTLDTLPASAATVLTIEELEQRAPARLYQALESVAGASKLGDGADSVPALRGLARGRTLILLDGARVTAERRAGPSATFVEPESLASVEVLRGPGSVVYGSDAFGGVINALTRDPEPGRARLRFGLETSAAALDQRAGYLAASLGVGEGSLLVEGHRREAEDAEAGGGVEIFNSSFRSFGGAARYLRDLGPGRLRLGAAADRNRDLGKAAIDSRSIRALYPEERSDRFNASWIGAPGGGWESLEGALAYGGYDLVLVRDRAPTATGNRRLDSSDTRARDASLRLVGARQAAGGRLQVGADAVARLDLRSLTGRVDFAADSTTVARRAESVSVAEASQLATGAFATWTGPLADKLSLGLGVRGDEIASRNRGGFVGDRSGSHSALSGNLALTAGPWVGWQTTAQLARGFRSPTLSDRYFRGPSGRGFVTGNPDLGPESSLQLDLAARWRRGRDAVGVYAYRYVIDDLIERFGAGDDFFFRNRGEATIAGVELEAQADFGRSWSSELGAAWADGSTDGPPEAAEIDDIAALNGWVTLRYSGDRGYLFGRLTAFLDHRQPGPTEVERPRYTVVDVGGGWRVREEIELRLMVRNAGDRSYTASPDETADRAAGRSVTVALSGRL